MNDRFTYERTHMSLDVAGCSGSISAPSSNQPNWCFPTQFGYLNELLPIINNDKAPVHFCIPRQYGKVFAVTPFAFPQGVHHHFVAGFTGRIQTAIPLTVIFLPTLIKWAASSMTSPQASCLPSQFGNHRRALLLLIVKPFAIFHECASRMPASANNSSVFCASSGLILLSA